MAPQETLIDKQCQAFLSHLQQEKMIDKVSVDFMTLSTDQDRVAFVLALPNIQNLVKLPDIPDHKSATAAAQSKAAGNNTFQQKKYFDAVQLYSQSIAEAPWDTNDLSLAFGNRSAALYHLGLWQECLLDIDRALASTFPSHLVHKLLTRQGQTLMKLAQYPAAKAALEKSLKALNSADLDKKKRISFINEIRKHLDECGTAEKLSKPEEQSGSSEVKCDRQAPTFPPSGCNSVFPSLSSACEITYSDNQGRYLVANRDISPGEVILIERPYASVLLPDQYTSYCHNCYAYCPAQIPCAKCATAMFCSEKCLNTAFSSYHQHECSMLRLLRDSGMGKFSLLALRTVTVMGWEGVRKYQQTLTHHSDIYPQSLTLHGCDSNGIYDPTDYRTIHCLVTHANDRKRYDLFRRAVNAVFLLQCVQKSDFMPNNLAEDEKCKMIEFIGGLLLSHLQSFPCNAHEISHFELDTTAVATSTSVEVGAGIYSALSLFNHSCDPAVTRSFYGNLCVVRSIRVLKQGEEITDNYGAVFAVHNNQERQEKLKPQYFFQCQCEPCSKHWPLYEDIRHDVPMWKCKDCHSLISGATGIIHCEKCGGEVDVSHKALELAVSQKAFEAALADLLSCDISNSLPVFLHHLETMGHLVSAPWREINNCQEALKQCYSIMGSHHVLS